MDDGLNTIMFLLIFDNQVSSTVEVITAIPKFYKQPKRIHYDMLRPIAEQFVQKRIVGWGVSDYPRYLSHYGMVWDHWETKGYAFDESQDWFVKCIDIDIGYPGICIGPAWRGIKVQPSPISDWINGGIELEGDQ